MKKIVGLLIVSIITIAVSFVYAADAPKFYFQPSSGTMFKLYCTNYSYFYVDGGNQNYNGFEAYIRHNTSDISIISAEVNNVFSKGKTSVLEGNLYHIGGATDNHIMGITGLVNIGFKTKRNIISTSFEIVDADGGNTYGELLTEDGLNLNSPDKNSHDILAGVENTTYKFYAYPCVIDIDKPIIGNVNKNGTATSVNLKTKIPMDQVLKFETYDWNTGRKVTHWFSGNDTSVLDNYVPVPSANNVDNQEGVNSGTILVNLSCAHCSTPRSNVSATLNITNWNGTTTKNALTWDSERRGYNVSFEPPFPYEVEKEVVVNISVTDNPNETGATHTQTKTVSFNAPVAPTITMIEPSNPGFVSPSKENVMKFYFSDDWAGVDSGTIWIKIKELTGDDGEILLTGYVYSGSDFSQVVLSGGSEGLGNEGKYEVSFYPKWDFPTRQTIQIEAYVVDLAGTHKLQPFEISTIPDCDFYGCKDPTKVVWPDESFWMYTGSLLIVSGHRAGSDYPYLDGDTLYCANESWSGTMLTGNIPLYKDGELKGNSYRYTGNKLNVTGDSRLNIRYEDGRIIADKE